MNIDITKAYTTRKGLKVHLYERHEECFFGRVYQFISNEWTPASWQPNGICIQNFGTDYDLVPMKQWRAWKDGEAFLFKTETPCGALDG